MLVGNRTFWFECKFCENRVEFDILLTFHRFEYNGRKDLVDIGIYIHEILLEVNVM